jgi:hypothetical protein
LVVKKILKWDKIQKILPNLYEYALKNYLDFINKNRVNINLRNNIEGLNLIQFFGELDHFIKECLIN